MFCSRPWILRLTPVLLDFAGVFDDESAAFSDLRRFAEGGVTVYTINVAGPWGRSTYLQGCRRVQDGRFLLDTTLLLRNYQNRTHATGPPH
jgi:hypothetical protein